MKKEIDENISKKFKKNQIKMHLNKKSDLKDNSSIFGRTFTNNFNSINKESNHLLNQKINNTKRIHKFNLTNQSTIIKNSTQKENFTSKNKTNITLGYETNRNNQNKNKINNKMTSSFYITQNEKSKKNIIPKPNIRKMIFNLSLNNNNITQRNKNRGNIFDSTLTYGNNNNINKETNKLNLSKISAVKKSENKIIRNERQNKFKKDNNKINNNNENNIKNKFERTKTLIRLKKQKNEEKKNTLGKSLNRKQQNDEEKKPYTNLYDKYLDQFKEKMQKLSLNNISRTDDDIKINHTKILTKKEMIKRYQTQTNFYKRNKDKKENEINIKRIKNNQELPKKQSTKVKIEKRKVGKSVGVKRDKDKDKEKNIISKKNKMQNSKNDNKITFPKRSKSMNKLTDKTKKNFNDEKYDIDYILYGELKPSKNEDPFDDVDTIVKQLNFDNIRLKSKNIFNVEDNEKYEKYSQNFENLFNKAISDNSLRKSIEKNKNNENNSNVIQNENTTDSFKKNKINVSFIDNPNN